MTVLSQHLYNGMILGLFVFFTGTIILQLYYVLFIFRGLAFYKSLPKRKTPEILPQEMKADQFRITFALYWNKNIQILR